MAVQEVGWDGMDWIRFVRGKGHVVGACECGNEPLGFIKCVVFCVCPS